MENLEVIEPSYQILTDTDGMLQHLEVCGRTCYKSEPNDADAFVKKIVKSGHESVLEHCSISVRFICDRSTSHQIVRHRLAAYSQESQRYCNYKDKFQVIAPKTLKLVSGIYHLCVGGYMTDGKSDITEEQKQWLYSCYEASCVYKQLLKTLRPEDARSVLPNATKTELVMTCNLRQWRHVFKERALNKHAQWQVRGLMLGVLGDLKIKLPAVFGDLQ